MALSVDCLPTATPLDPAEEPPGSLDPLGTLNHAERLAEVLLPAFTVRMWRARLLTFAAVAAAVADRTVDLMGGREDLRLEARLAFERLFVSAIIRLAEKCPADYRQAVRRLPGRDLARKALVAGEPLTRGNFLKGQAVNGPFGVIARLARQLELIDDEGRGGRNSTALLAAWQEDEQIPGVLDEDRLATRPGAAWMTDATKVTAASLGKHEWPGGSHRVWEELARHLRPDQIGPKERRVVLQMLEAGSVRRRVFGLLVDHIDVFRDAWQAGNRGHVERTVLLRGIRPHLEGDQVDRLIANVITAIDSYEQTAGLLQQAFEGLICALKQRGGRAVPGIVLGDARVNRHLERTRLALGKTIPRLDGAMERLRNQSCLDPTQFVEPLGRLREDAVAALASERDLAQAVLQRHERVQREKAKAPWIEREAYWTLMPGENRVSGDAPPIWQDTFLHPFKIPNAYAMLGDLGRVSGLEDQDAEE